MISKTVRNKHLIRIEPEKELGEEIKKYCKENNISNGFIPVLQGGFKKCTLVSMEKTADENNPKPIEKDFDEPLEFFGQGIVCPDEEKGGLSFHSHLSCAKTNKSMIGGHFVNGIVVYHVEVVLVELNEVNMARKSDKDIYNANLIYFKEE